jgi:hypothetical protein
LSVYVICLSCFTVLADETTDISSKEQFSLCVRYVKKAGSEYKMCEQFLQFMPLESLTGEHLASTLLRGLQECYIEEEFLREQGYAGAAAMSGKFKGTQAYIPEKYPTALYLHCVSHSLNLAISNSAEVSSIRNCFGVTEKIYTFFNTPKRQLVLLECISKFAPDAKKNYIKSIMCN